MRWTAALILSFLCTLGHAAADQRDITVAATTSTDNAGFFDYLLPMFRADTGIGVRILAAGTGQAIRYAQRGDADVLFVHHRASEEQFVAEGYGIERFDVMYNDFIIIGPAAEPAGISGATDAAQALAKIAQRKMRFVSRGDDSGTHKRELSLWREAGVDIRHLRESWYLETGTGQGATLNTAVAIEAYCMTDRATWISAGNRGALKPLVRDDNALLNQYGVVVVNPKRHPHIHSAEALTFVDWLLSSKGQTAINAFKINGEQVFYANAVSVN